MSFAVGSLVKARGREWVVLPVAKLYVGVLHREGPEAQGHRVCSATSD